MICFQKSVVELSVEFFMFYGIHTFAYAIRHDSECYIDGLTNFGLISDYDSIFFRKEGNLDSALCDRKRVWHYFLYNVDEKKYIPMISPLVQTWEFSIALTSDPTITVFSLVTKENDNQFLTRVYYNTEHSVIWEAIGKYKVLICTEKVLVLRQVGILDKSLNLFNLHFLDRNHLTLKAMRIYGHLTDPYQNQPIPSDERVNVFEVKEDGFIAYLELARMVVEFNWEGEIIWKHLVAGTPAFFHLDNVVYLRSDCLCVFNSVTKKMREISLYDAFLQMGLIILHSQRHFLTDDGWLIFPVSNDLVSKRVLRWHSVWAVNVLTGEMCKLFDAKSADGSCVVTSCNYGQGWLSVVYKTDSTYRTHLYYRADKPLAGFGLTFFEKYNNPEVWEITGKLISTS